MKLVEATKNFKSNSIQTKSTTPIIKNAVSHLVENAAPGNPYSVATLFDELVKAELLRYDSVGLSVIGLVLQKLVSKHGWYEFGKWGYFGRDGKTTIRQVLEGACVRGGTFDIQGCSQIIEILTGEEVPPGQIRKTLQRLVKSGNFIRVDRGRYQRVTKGFTNA